MSPMDCDHTPDGELRGHLELWRTDEGWTALSFVVGQAESECYAECDTIDPPLEIAAERLADAAMDVDLILWEESR